jgi:hypothetical protein
VLGDAGVAGTIGPLAAYPMRVSKIVPSWAGLPLDGREPLVRHHLQRGALVRLRNAVPALLAACLFTSVSATPAQAHLTEVDPPAVAFVVHPPPGEGGAPISCYMETEPVSTKREFGPNEPTVSNYWTASATGSCTSSVVRITTRVRILRYQCQQCTNYTEAANKLAGPGYTRVTATVDLHKGGGGFLKAVGNVEYLFPYDVTDTTNLPDEAGNGVKCVRGSANPKRLVYCVQRTASVADIGSFAE